MPPNILFLHCHDLGRYLGCYGRTLSTPHLDALAAQGVIFTNAFCTAPSCSPSRGSIMTGRLPHANGLMGLVNMGWRLNVDEITLPRLLSEAGYATHLFGIQHESDDSASLGYQHLHRDVDLTYKAPMLADDLAALLHTNLSQPFFISAGFVEPHRRFPKDIELDGDPPEAPWLPDHQVTRREMAGFTSLVQRVDRAVGQILGALEATGRAEDTVVVFTTDHGIDMPRAKGTLYDPGIETALLMRWPNRIAAAHQCHALVSTMDLFPTLAEIAGAPIPRVIHGQSLCPLLFDRQQAHREHVIAEKLHHCCYDPMRAIRTERYKFINNFGALRSIEIPADVDMDVVAAAPHLYRQRRSPIELYNLLNDPWEQHNLAGQPEWREVEGSLAALLRRNMEETADPLLQGYLPMPTILPS
jgi:arylsulfatase A-like enzyme